MTLERNQIRKGQKGFTLVELAVVMIIIGLLIGGILKGQELIANAQVTSTISQTKGIEAAISTFRDSYRAFPGDMLAPQTRLPNCTAAPCNVAGNGNGRLTLGPAAAAATSENLSFFSQLLATDLLGGFNGTNDTTFGGGLPVAPAGGGLFVGYHAGNAALGATTGNARGGHYLSLRGLPAAPDAASGALNANQAQRIDNKADDGNAITGSTFVAATTSCSNAGVYDTVNNPQGCNLYIRVQN